MNNVKAPKVSILMVLKNNANTIKKCVKSILDLNFKDFELIILDNNSDDNSLDFVKSFSDPRIQIFSLKRNLGYAAGNNYCYQRCVGEWILVVNPDIIADKNLIDELLKAYNFISKSIGNEKIILSPKIILLDNTINYIGGNINILGFSTVKGLGKIDNYKKKYELTDFFSGCCFFIKTKHFKALGGFDPYYFMYHEDVDFSLRARYDMFKIFVINTTKIKHMKHLEDFKLTNLKYYMIERNRLLTLIKNSPFIPSTILTILFFEPILIIQSFFIHKSRMRALIYVNIFKVFKKYLKYNKFVKKNLILKFKTNFQDFDQFIGSRLVSLIILILNSYIKIIYNLFWKKLYRRSE